MQRTAKIQVGPFLSHVNGRGQAHLPDLEIIQLSDEWVAVLFASMRV
jgi:hypothetical protein